MKILRQVWQLVKRQKLYTAIYIFGTALALATVTVYAVQLRTRIAPVYPEYQRPRMAVVNHLQVSEKNGHMMRQSAVGYESMREYLLKVRSADHATGIRRHWADSYVQSVNGGLDRLVKFIATDTAYFDIFTLDFIAGGPFTHEQFEGGSHAALIDTDVARAVFGAGELSELLGREFTVDHVAYRLTGIYRPMSEGVPVSYANVIAPYTAVDNNGHWGNSPFLGNYWVVYTTDSPEALREEFNEIERRYNSSQDEYELDFFGAPFAHTEFSLGNGGEDFTLSDVLAVILGTFFVLLLVPALNLSGMVAGRMERRLPEIGVRKSYGATDGVLLLELLNENLILTLAGAIVGFVWAWIMLSTGMAGITTTDGPDVAATGEMIFAPAVFVFCFVVSLLLNIASALIPAARALRRPIVTALNSK